MVASISHTRVGPRAGDITTSWASREAADAIAISNMIDDEDGWTFRAVEKGSRFVVEVFDEDGFRLGTL